MTKNNGSKDPADDVLPTLIKAPFVGTPFEIEGKDGEVQTGSNGFASLTLYPDGISRMRKRTAIKGVMSENARKVQWLYGELDGVRVYVHEELGRVHIVMSRQDLYP